MSGKGVFVLRFEGPVPTESCTPEVYLLPEISLSSKLSEKRIKLSLFLESDPRVSRVSQTEELLGNFRVSPFSLRRTRADAYEG